MTQRPSAAPEALLDWLYAQQRFGIRPGLERVSALLECLGHPERQFRVVLVGGTNGKGSVSATLASILQAAGQRTGLFTVHICSIFPNASWWMAALWIKPSCMPLWLN